MSNDKYTINAEIVESIDYEILLIGRPDSELEDLLTNLVEERGRIAKSRYEDFLIANCIANLNQFMAHITTVASGVSEDFNLMKVREEALTLILKHNEALEPNNVVINRNKVLKLKTDDNLKDCQLLEDNPHWGQSFYDEYGNYTPVSKKASYENVYQKRTGEKQVDGQPEEIEKISSVSELPYEEKRVWWERFGEYIIIRKYSEDDVNKILTFRYFHNSTSFNTFIVSNCVKSIEDIYERIDGMGITIDPKKIISDLYALCITVNPNLTFTKFKELRGSSEEDDANNVNLTKSSQAPQPSVGFGNKLKKENGPMFRDVSKKELLSLSSNIKLSLIGQDDAVDTVTEAIKRASVGLKNPDKPIGSFLFAGKTGVGKSLTSKVLANELIKTKKNRIVIDCSEYLADNEYTKLIGCFVPGTKIKMASGVEKNIEEVSIGDEVVSHTGNIRKVNYVHEYDQKGDMVELQMANSNVPVVTTKTHEIYAIKHSNCDKGEKRSNRVCKPTCKQEYCVNPPYENYKLEWLPASELEVNDVVVYPRYKPTGKIPNVLDMLDYVGDIKKYNYDDEFIWAKKHVKIPRYVSVNEDLFRLAGYYVSEGGRGYKNKTINFTFNNKEHSYIVEVVKLIRKVFGMDVRIRVEDRSKKHSYRIWVSSKLVCNFMTSLFGINTYVKKVPGWFKDAPDNMVKGFLETAVFGDGCTVIPRRMDYSTVSSSLFTMMELLFRRLGYITSKQVEIPKNTNWKKRYRLYISGNQIEKLNTDFNFNIDLSGLSSTNIQRKAWIDDDYIYIQLKGVSTTTYTGKVYDLAVEKDTSYITEFVVHNSPPGYLGHDSGGVLTEAIAENPFSVVVFDEIEKANSKIFDLMLQILDEGRLTDGKGKTVSFKDAIIIMTSNVGVNEISSVGKTIGFGDVAIITEDKKNGALKAALRSKFKPEFLNRLDSVVYFKDLTKDDYKKIIELELEKLNENLKSNDTDYKDITLTFDKKIKTFIYNKGVDSEYGARPITRAIEKYIANDVAALLLEDQVALDAEIKVTTLRGRVDLKVAQNEESNILIHSEVAN
jgi:DNA polymerase III delta prime subunit